MRWTYPIATLLFTGLASIGCGQWSLGPQVQVAVLHRDPVVLLSGLGASVTRNTSERFAWWGDLRWHFPQRTNTSLTSGGPAGLQAGDTVLSTHDITNWENVISTAFGLQRTLNREPREGEWHWALGLGFGASLDTYQDNYTHVHTEEQGQSQGMDLSPFLLGRLGLGHAWHLSKADLVCTLTDDWAYSTGNNMVWPSSNAGHHSIALTVSYRWRM